MLDRLSVALYCAYSNVKIRLMRLAKEESGMETLEVVILIAVAVIIAGLIINFLTKDGFELSDGTTGGLLQFLFDKIKTSVNDLFA